MPKTPLSRIQQARLAFDLLRDPRVPLWTKTALPAAVLVYALAPVDLIPDFLAGIGQVDDFIVAILASIHVGSFMRRYSPAFVVNHYLQTLCSRGVADRPAAVASWPANDARFYAATTRDPSGDRV